MGWYPASEKGDSQALKEILNPTGEGRAVSGCVRELQIWMEQVQQCFGGAIVMLLAQSGIADAPIGIPTLSDSSLVEGAGGR